MNPRFPKFLAALGCLALLGFGWGLWQLFSVRLDTGDVYPPYSSFRADPLGAKALHDSLRSFSSLRVGRNFRPLDRLEHPQDTTVFWLGTEHNTIPEAEWRSFVRGGGRLVVGWLPSQFVERLRTNTTGPFPWQQARYRKGPLLPREALSQRPEDVAFRSDWGLNLEFIALPGTGSEFKSDTARLVADRPLPDTVAWHSTVCFTNLHADWQTIYERRGRPVLVERRIGEGTVVVTTDCWATSNEALRTARETELLAWFAGAGSRVLFDEQHLGVTEDAGLATLLRRYRMHGLAGAALVLALLFLWRNLTSFLPRSTGAGEPVGADIAGRDAAAGFVNLLRRSLKPVDLPKTSFQEWKQSLGAAGGCSKERLDRMEQAIMSFEDAAPGERNVITTYQALHAAWKERR